MKSPNDFLKEPYVIYTPIFATMLGVLGVWHFARFFEMLDNSERGRWTTLLEEHGGYAGYVHRWRVTDNCIFLLTPEVVAPFDTKYKTASFNSFQKGFADRGGVVPLFAGDFTQFAKRLPGESDVAYEFRLIHGFRSIFAGIAENARRAAG